MGAAAAGAISGPRDAERLGIELADELLARGGRR